MSAIKVIPSPRPRIWIDPIPRHTWEYEKRGRTWYGDYGPMGLRHDFGYTAFSERGIRRKLAKKIRAERRRDFEAYLTKRASCAAAASPEGTA